MRSQDTQLEKLLEALAARAEQAEVYAIDSEATTISFEAAEIKSAQVDETHGVALRGLTNGRVGFTATSGSIDAEALVERTVASAQFGEPVEIEFPGRLAAPAVDAYDPTLAQVPVEQLIELGQGALSRLKEHLPDTKIDITIERASGTSMMLNSAGARVTQPGSALQISLMVERVRGDDVMVAYDGVSATGLATELDQAVRRVIAQVRAAERPAQADSGRLPVLFTPAGATLLLLPLMMGLNGENFLRGTSPLATRVGEQMLDARLSLWDDPTLPGHPASAAYDDEGVPRRRKALIRAGTIEGPIYDLETAALMGSESTGNGSRGLFSLPSPSISNLVLEAGETPLQEMLAGIRHGLLVDSVLGMGMGNVLSGAFSNPVSLAYVIEDGEIVGRVKDLSLAGNVYDLLRSIGGISREQQWVHGRYLLPHILLNEVDVVRGR